MIINYTDKPQYVTVKLYLAKFKNNNVIVCLSIIILLLLPQLINRKGNKTTMVKMNPADKNYE